MDGNGSTTSLTPQKLVPSTASVVPSASERPLHVVRVASVLAATAGLAVLAGWFSDIESLKTLMLGSAPMRVNTAIGFVLLGVSLWGAVVAPKRPLIRGASICTTIVVMVLGIATLSQYLFLWDFHIDELLFQDHSADGQETLPGFAPGRPSPAAAVAISLIALAIALLALEVKHIFLRWLTQALILVPLVVSILALLGYAYGIESPFRVPPRVVMAESSAVVFMIICVGLLFARRDFELIAPIESPYLGGAVARKLLPAILILPVLGWLWLQGEYQGRYGREFGFALSSVTAMVLLLGVVWWNARSLNQVDVKRRQAEDAVRESERIYRAIGESINYGVWLCDAEGKNLYASRSFLDLVGMTQQECAEYGWGSVLHPDDAERTISAWKECVRTRGTWDIEHRFRGVDGAWHSVLARGVPVTNEQGDIHYWAGINLDIARLKDAEHKLTRAFDDLERRIEERTAELTTVNNKLRQSLEEKEVLLKEVHHRVKNNLQVVSSLLHLQSLHSNDDASVEMFHESQNRVRSMALVHERLYHSNDLARVDFTDYIQGVANSLFQSYGVDRDKIGLSINVGDARLTIDTAVPCGLVINEMVSNCLKHAFSGRSRGQINIDLVGALESDILLRVADDGVGLPANFDPATAVTFGMQVIVALVEQLHGRLEVVRGEGTEFRVIFPNSAF